MNRFLAAALFAVAAQADQMQLVMPIQLAARVVGGPTWDGGVTLEPEDASTVRVTVEAQFGGKPGQTRRLLGEVPPPPESLQVETLLPLPAQLLALRSAPASEKLLETVVWVSRNVRLVETDRGPQDAASVLRRRVGRCSGRANLAVALLRQLGVPARVVHGLLVRAGGAFWHRWGEAWLPGVGWRPFDPGVSVGVAGVRYLPMTGAEDGLSLRGVRVVSIAEPDFLRLPRRYGMQVALPRGSSVVALLGQGGL